MSLAAITLVLVFQRELTRMSGSSVAYGALVGAFLWMGNELQTCGLKYITPSKSAFNFEVFGFSELPVSLYASVRMCVLKIR
jgi:hypothetical protein